MSPSDIHISDQDSSLALILAMIRSPEFEGGFPNHAVFVSSGHPHFSAFVAGATDEERPVVVAFADGGYMIVEGKPSADMLVGELHLAGDNA